MMALVESLPSDPLFYLVAAIAVVVTGVSKGGFGGVALLAVPLLSLVVSPMYAAAIMLPLLLLMDGFGIFVWRGKANWPHLKKLLPGAFVGILVGAATARFVEVDQIRLVVGLIAILFCLHSWWPWKRVSESDSDPNNMGVFWGSIAGYTSYIAHAGSPPYQTYLLPKGLSKEAFAATGVWFFALVNLGKLPAYVITGQLTFDAFIVAALFMPLVPVGFCLGVWLNKKISHVFFYRMIYGAVFLTGLKLVHSALI